MWWLLACAARVTGLVQDEAGAPVAGVTLDALGCDAVTDTVGQFSVSCPPGSYTFSVSHPDTLPLQVTVDAPRGTSTAPPIRLVRKPIDPGLFVYAGDESPGFTRLPAAPLIRTEHKDGARARHQFCVSETASFAPAKSGAQEIWDNRSFTWKLFKLDDARCAWEVKTEDGTWWEGVGKPVEPLATETRSEGRFTLRYTLPDGEYVIAEWYADYLVPDGEHFRAYGLRVGGA